MERGHDERGGFRVAHATVSQLLPAALLVTLARLTYTTVLLGA